MLLDPKSLNKYSVEIPIGFASLGEPFFGFTAIFSLDASSKLQGASVKLTPVDHGGSVEWSCSGTDLNEYLPSKCVPDGGSGDVGNNSDAVIENNGPTNGSVTKKTTKKKAG